MTINAPKGTRDVFPDQSGKWQYIEREFRRICTEYGYGEIRTPMFERTELFDRGIGETTDVVQKEMYTFEDLGHRSMTLKPEGTSPAVRAFIESKHYADMQPSKYYYDMPCFRYEKPQAGRLREFHQFGIEIFGSNSMFADAEIISLGREFLDRMGIGDVELRINSVGCRKCRPAYRKVLQDFIRPKLDQLCDTCKSRFETNPMRILDCKSPEDQELIKGAPVMLDHLCDECRSDFDELKKILDDMGIPYNVDPGIVRGLDYYTKTAFEFVTTRIGAQGTICGGGRYDHLIEEIDGPDMPGVGFGLGKERLLLLMEEYGIEFPDETSPDVFIAYIGDKAKSYALGLVTELRSKHISAVIDTQDRNLKGQMKYANKIGAVYSIVIGDDEIESGDLTLKKMSDSSQSGIKREDIAEMIGRQI